MLRPLGFGDLMMLSPFIIEIARRAIGIPTYLVTEYTPFLDISGIRWMHPRQLSAQLCSTGLLLSPTLSWRHARYLRHAGWYLGYFFSDRVMSNFTQEHPGYDARRGHYFERAEKLFALLDQWFPGTLCYSYAGILSAPLTGIDLPEKYICIAPFTNWAERQYPADQMCCVVDSLLKNWPVVLVGGQHPDEMDMAAVLARRGAINLVGKTTIQQTGGIVVRAKLFIGNDSGLSHMAFLAGTPSLVVFGCVSGQQRIPLDPILAKKVTILGAGKSCSYFPCYDGFNKPCCRNQERYLCLKQISPELVIDSAMNKLVRLDR